jgi:hypothetical protein
MHNACIVRKDKNFSPAGATKGLSGRPLETFGGSLFACCIVKVQYKVNK